MKKILNINWFELQHKTNFLKKNARRGFLSVLLLLMLFGFCQVEAQKSDSLAAYLEMAGKNNPAVLQKLSEYQAALQKIPQVGSLPDPELSAGVFLKPMELLGGNQVADLRLMQMFPWFGTLKAAKDEMSLMAKAKYESFRDTRISLYYEVTVVWYEMTKYREQIKIAEENISLLNSIERLTLTKYSTANYSTPSTTSGSNSESMKTKPDAASAGMKGMSGDLSNGSTPADSQPVKTMGSGEMGTGNSGSSLVDLYRIQSEKADLEENIAQLGNSLKTASIRFNSYLNRSAFAKISLPDTLILVTCTYSPEPVPDSILARNPMLVMSGYEQQSLDSRYKMVTRMSYPMLGVGLNYSVIKRSDMSVSSMNGTDMVMPMVTFTIPVYRKKYKSMKDETTLLKNAARSGFDATSNSLQVEYYEAVQKYNDALRKQKLYENQTRLADQSLRIMLKSFSGEGTALTDILRVRQQLLEYKTKFTEAVTDYNTAVARINRLIANN